MKHMSSPIEQKRAFRVNEIVAAYSLSRSTIYNLIRQDKLRAVKIGRRTLIPIESIERLLSGEGA